MTRQNNPHNAPGLIVLFGSGETSPTGRKIHEDVMKRAGLQAPVRIGILETPTGFEVNAIHGWPERMEKFFANGLQNYKPAITRIRAWRKEGKHSTNDPKIVDAILAADYLYCGAGAPEYAVRHLTDSLALARLVQAHAQGAVLCLGSAGAIAMGQYALPVYEIFKSGYDLFWRDGLRLFESYGINTTIIPHWNNQDGEDFDTTRCWMGKSRFSALVAMLPHQTRILGIDEETACVIDLGAQTMDVLGVGSAHVIRNGRRQTFKAGDKCSLKLFQ